jgi:pimeloyl-ACP methyl ester carboxylesterase
MFQVLWGCKTQEQDSQVHGIETLDNRPSADANGESDTAFLFFGGFGSCSYTNEAGHQDNVNPIPQAGSTMDFSMFSWVPYMNRAYTAPHRHLIACYPLWTGVPPQIQEAMTALSGTKPVQIDGQRPNPLDSSIYFRHNLAGSTSLTQKLTLQGMLDSLESQLASHNIKRVVILGHSYGGYTAILAAKALTSPHSRVKVSSLTTLDPISMDTCRPEDITRSIVNKSGEIGCNQAPTVRLQDANLTKDDIASVATKTPWTNLWQSVDKYLHSSAIDAPSIYNREAIYSRKNPDGIANHIFFVFPGTKSASSDWPTLVDEVVQRAVEPL